MYGSNEKRAPNEVMQQKFWKLGGKRAAKSTSSLWKLGGKRAAPATPLLDIANSDEMLDDTHNQSELYALPSY
jgi:hypothetical protein